ncbi:SpoIIE family protein phosphatase [Kutzneria albida]|uniref:histidine kinase n=1 Tax=Kutzneria albida DSM 43870 TaxID=1449976 RepID=W5WA22_9PSEU|nr:SpoIIE family protein phosphatase [Kutzneria albida]AHH97978.1 hypothetical protein KALB_4616 [Kutzneria albida DSM 43870]
MDEDVEADLLSLAFPGDSAMAARMREVDWASSPLGPQRDWPAALRTACRICLTSRFPMIVWWGQELRFLYNDAYLPLLGSKHPALGKPGDQVWTEIWHIIGPMLRGVLATGQATWSDDLLLPMDRHGYWEETYWTYSYSPLHDEDGSVVGVFTAVSETTERVVGERRMAMLRGLGAKAGGLRSAGQACRAVVDSLGPDVPYAAIYLGGPPELTAASGPAFAGWPVAEVLATGSAVHVHEVRERIGELPGGAWDRPPTEALVFPLRNDSGGEPLGVIVLAASAGRALDEPYRTFLALAADQSAALINGALAYEFQQRRAEELAELDKAKTAFFANISHEFRTPLTLITGPLRELREAARGAEREQLAVVERNAQRLGKLVNSLLDFSRIEAGRVEAAYEPVDLGTLTAELAGLFRSAIDRAGLRLAVDCPPLDPPAHVDRGMWEKIVFNLVGNALKFTFSGSIRVDLHPVAGCAVLTVADTGVGVPEEELPRLFERFHRIEQPRSRSTEGSGIGLALVRELVGLHGGEVEVSSEVDVGTTFTVRIPLGSAHLPAANLGASTVRSDSAAPFVEEAEQWLPGTEPTAPREPAQVLIADDNADMRGYLTRLLGARYRTVAVADGVQALRAVREAAPDLVISDVMMPGLDGLGLVAALREDPRTARVPVLLLSARAGEEASAEGLTAGADDYLVKPFSARELLSRVNAHVRLGRVRRQGEQRFRSMADVAPALIWAADRAGDREFVNRGWTEFTGTGPTYALGMGWQRLVHPQDLDRYRAALDSAVDTGGALSIEYRLRRADGAYHWMLEHAVPIGQGAEFSGHVASCVDINARYQETERQRLLAQFGAELDDTTGVVPRLDRLTRLMVQTRLADQCTVRRTDQADGPRRKGTEMVVPLRARGRTLAVLTLRRDTGAADYTDANLALVTEIASRAGIALDNALLLAEEQTTAARLALLQQATAELSAATTPAQVARTAVAHGLRLLGECEIGVFELRDPEVLEPLTPPGHQRSWTRIDLTDRSPVTDAVSTHRPVWIERLEDCAAEHPAFPDLMRATGFAAGAVVPLIVAGRCLGVITVGAPVERVFDPGDRLAVLSLAEQCAQALDRARMYRAEHEIAEVLQRSLLPKSLPEVDRLALATRYLPGAEGTRAGGDWYDVLRLDADRVAIVVGDVVGQGPTAAAVMGQLRSAVAAYLLEGHSPAECLRHLNEFAERVPAALASTVACLVIDCGTGELCWARAGHVPPVLVRDGEASLLTGAVGTVLGLGAELPLTEERREIAPGDTVLLYTDGLVERRGEDLDLGLDRLVANARELAGLPAEQVASDLVTHQLADQGPNDDVALVVARLLPVTLRERLPAVPAVLASMRTAVRAWARSANLAADLLDDLQLVLGEAAANAVEHAYPGVPDGEFEYELRALPDGAVSGRVRDFGAWRPVPADKGSRGRGLELIGKLARDSSVCRGADGTEVTFVLSANRVEVSR